MTAHRKLAPPWCRMSPCYRPAITGSDFCAHHQHAANEPPRPGVRNQTQTAPRKRVSAQRRRIPAPQSVRRPDPGTPKETA